MVILEDAIILKLQFPDSPLFAHVPFSDPEFLKYQQNALQAFQRDDIPMAIQVQRLVPEIATELHTIITIMSSQLSLVTKNIDHMQNRVTTVIGNQKSHNDRLMTIERFADRMNRGQIRVISQLQTDFDGTNLFNIGMISPIGPLLRTLLFSFSYRPIHPSLIFPYRSRIPPRSLSSESVPEYMISISIMTVDDAFKEWNTGLINGTDGIRSPSIRHLEENFGTKWRKSTAAQQRYI